MRPRLLTGLILLLISNIIAAQFVGDGGPQSTPEKQNTTKGLFTLKFGAAIPLGNYGTVPDRTSEPQYNEGVMGATTGFFAEAGVGLSLTNPEKKVGFYYFPILASYWRTSLDWSDLGSFFADNEIYKKPVNLIDIGQRYGIVVRPIDNLFTAFYYRPGLVIPLKFEVSHESDGESFFFMGEMSTAEDAPALMMSHTAGFSLRYRMATISVEEYFSKPTYDITYKDVDSDPYIDINETTMSKIPIKLLIISLALNF